MATQQEARIAQQQALARLIESSLPGQSSAGSAEGQPIALSGGSLTGMTAGTMVEEPDSRWRDVITTPAVILILGKRGSGKSALAHRLLELYRMRLSPYVIGVPAQARKLLPDWVGIASSLEELPTKSIALIDEAYLKYHSRGSMATASRSMSQLLNLSRQKEQTLILVSQEARQVDKNIASSASVVVFKDLGMLQLEFDRPELNRLATKARDALNQVDGDRRRWSYVYAPDTDFMGVLSNGLPSFWKPGLSKVFAGEATPATPRDPKQLTPSEKAIIAKRMKANGDSYSTIARVLGVTRGTVVNYVKDYPYRKR
jgi:hypothetical protein